MTLDLTDAQRAWRLSAPSLRQAVTVSAAGPSRLPLAVELARHLPVSLYCGSSPWPFLEVQPPDGPPALPVHDSPADSVLELLPASAWHLHLPRFRRPPEVEEKPSPQACIVTQSPPSQPQIWRGLDGPLRLCPVMSLR